MAKKQKTIAQIQAICKAKKGKAYREGNGPSREYYHIVNVVNFDEGVFLFVVNYLVSKEVRVVNEYYVSVVPGSYDLFFEGLKPVKRDAFLKLKRQALAGLGNCKDIIKNYKK